MKRRIWTKSMFVITIITVIVIGYIAVNAESSTVIASGKCGNTGSDVFWSVDSNMTLTISGAGQMKEYPSNNQPWVSYTYYIKKVVVENGITSVGYLGDISECECLVIGKDVCSFGDFFEHNRNTTLIIVDPENRTFKSDGGALLSFDGTKLIVFSSEDYIEKYEIPNGVVEISAWAFHCHNVDEVVIPDSVKIIGEYAFSTISNILYSDKMTAEGSPWGAQNANCYFSGNYVFKDAEHTSLIEYNGDVNTCAELIIPDGVIEIGDFVFNGYENVKSVNIPNSVKYIGKNAFSCLYSVKSITIPDSVITIEKNAFYNVQRIIFSEKMLADGAPWGALQVNTFEENNLIYSDSTKRELVGCNKNAEGPIIIPNGVKVIKSNAFLGIYGIDYISIPDSVETIENNAFYGILNIEHSDDMKASGSPWGAENVNGYIDGPFIYSNSSKKVLISCSKLANGSVIIPSDVESISEKAFSYCDEIESVTIPVGINTINSKMFYNCTKLRSVVMLGDIESIEEYAFSGCISLSDISIPKSVRKIGREAFLNCKSIANICIPDSVDTIGNLAFCGVKNIIFSDDMSAAGSPWGAYHINCVSDGTFYYSDSKMTEIVDCYNYIPGEVVIPNTVVSIKKYIFDYHNEVDCVVIPESLECIHEGTFSALKRIIYDGTRQNAVEKFSNGGVELSNNKVSVLYLKYEYEDEIVAEFDYKTNTFKLTKELEKHSFSSPLEVPWKEISERIVNVEISNDITVICDYCFYHCNNITEVTIPNGVKTIGKAAFVNCDSLCRINVGTEITSIGEDAFKNTSFSLNPQNYENNLLYLDNNNQYLISFGGSNIHQSFSGKIHSKTKLISDGAFSDADIERVNLSNCIEFIGSKSFANTKIKEIHLPKSIQSIEKDAFNGCENLTIYYEGNKAQFQKTGFKSENVYYLISDNRDNYLVVYSDKNVELGASDGINLKVCSECLTDENSLFKKSKLYDSDTVTVYNDTLLELRDGDTKINVKPDENIQLNIVVPEDIKKIIISEISKKYPKNIIDFSTVELKNDRFYFYVNGTKTSLSSKEIASENRFRFYLIKNNNEIESYSFSDISLNNGYFIINVPFLGELAIVSSNEAFDCDDYSVLVGQSLKVDCKHNQNENIVYKVADNSVATVDDKGNVFGVNDGSTMLTAYIDGVAVAYCMVNVNELTCDIVGYTGCRTIDCRQTMTFRCTTTVPDNTSIHWLINGGDVGTGESYTVLKPKDNYAIQVKAFDVKGNVIAESEVELVKVKHGFFDILSSFFKDLFGLISPIEQK